MKSLVIALVFSVLLAVVSAFCWTQGPYHIASGALAVGVGNVSSASVCVYSTDNPQFDSSCPLPCQALIAATWGDCYCRDPNYQPQAAGADNFIRPFSVFQIFQFLAGEGPFGLKFYANCRNWIADPNQRKLWTCQ